MNNTLENNNLGNKCDDVDWNSVKPVHNQFLIPFVAAANKYMKPLLDKMEWGLPAAA